MQWGSPSRFLSLYLLIIIADSAFIEAQSVGQVPELCTTSEFLGDYQRCEDCIAANSSISPPELSQDLIQLQPFISYCATNANASSSALLASYAAQEAQLTSLLSELASLEKQTQAPSLTTPSRQF
jgi:hypothetical protein